MAINRFSLKRCFVYVICLTGMLYVVVNVRQKEIWNSIVSTEQLQSTKIFKNNVKVGLEFNIN